MPKKKPDYASLYTRRKDGRYVGSYTDETGRHYVYDRDPERLWHKLNDPKEEKPVTFAQISDAWQDRHWERIGWKTIEAYTPTLRRILDRFGALEAKAVTAQMVNAYLLEMGKNGYARYTVQRSRDIMNMIFNDAIVSGVLTFNPVSAVSLPRNLPTAKRELPSDEAIEAVKSGLDAPFGLFGYLCLYSGLRRGEALALRYEDIDREHHVIHVTKAVEFIGNSPHLKAPKTAAGYRDVILLDVLARAIPEGSGLIFCREDGAPLTKTQYRKRWLKYCQAIGYDITAHQLRHGFATILYEAGIPDKDAQELLGHSSIAVTRDVYTHIRRSRREETTARLNSFIEKEPKG